MTEDKHLRVLIVAPNASAKFGGEAILPLHYFKFLLRRGYCVRLITHVRNRSELLSLPDVQQENIYFVPDTKMHRLVWIAFSRVPNQIRDLIGGAILNWLDEIHQARIIRALVKSNLVDLIHQPTPVSPLTPSSLHKFGIPLIVGPMNGGMDFPPGYEDYESNSTRITVSVGRKVALIVNRLRPGKLKAAVLLVANQRTRNILPFSDHPRIEMLVENGVDFNLWQQSKQQRFSAAPGQLRLVFLGRLIKLKAVDLTLRAILAARNSGANITLDIVGDGEERAALETFVEKLGLKDYVTFHGFQDQRICVDFLVNSDALILNSLRECGGAVVLEAMAVGLPVIACAWGGPMDYVSAGSGILISPEPRENFVSRLSEAMIFLANNPEARRELGESAKETVRREYDWERKIDKIEQIYHSVLKN